MNSFSSASALLLTAILSSACSVMAADNNRVVYETEKDADIDAVWNAFKTNDRLRTWMAPIVEMELAVGGKMKSNYNAKGKIGDETTIENTILSFDPKRMLSLKATGFPKGFSIRMRGEGHLVGVLFHGTPVVAHQDHRGWTWVHRR